MGDLQYDSQNLRHRDNFQKILSSSTGNYSKSGSNNKTLRLMNTEHSQYSHPSLIRPLHPNSHASSGNFGPQQKSFQNNNPNAPYSFMLNSNVQENYSAYRRNGNMGMPNQGSTSSHNPRIGFFGEVYAKNAGPQNNNPQYNLSLVSHPQNKNSSKFFQNGMSVVSPQSLQNVSRSPPPEFAYKPSPFGQSPNTSNPLLNQNFAPPPKQHFIDSGYNHHPSHPHRPMQLQRMPSLGHNQSMHQAPINLPPIYTPQNKHLAQHMKSPSHSNLFNQSHQQLNQSISRLEKVVSAQNEIVQHLMHNNASFMHDSTRKPSSRQGIKPLNLNLSQSVHAMKPINLNTSTLNDSHRSYGNNTPTNMNHTVQHYEDSAGRLPSVNNISQHQNGEAPKRVVGKNLLINVLSKMKSEPVSERGTPDVESLNRIMSHPTSPQHFQTKKSEKTSQESINLDTKEGSSLSTLQETSTPILKSKRFEFGSLEKLGSRKNVKDNRDRKPRSKKVVTINSEIELLGEDSPKLPPVKPLDLRQVLWSMMYPFFLTKLVDEKVAEKKKKIEQNAPKEIEKQNTIALQFIQKHCQSSLKSIYKASNCQIVKDEEYGDSDISEKSTKKRFLNIITKLTAVMQDFNKGLDKAGLPSEFSQYFRNITDNGSVLPPKFLTEYESSLLEFSYYGTLKHMAPAKLKMILASFFLIKKLTFCNMAKPWDFSSKVKKSIDLQRNLKSFSSVLYAIIMSTFKDLKQTKSNQAFIHPDKRVKVLKPLLAFEDESTDNPRLKNEALHHEVLFGMYRRTLLDLGFDSYPEEVEKVKKLVEECIEKLYEQVVFNQDKIAENNAK